MRKYLLATAAVVVIAAPAQAENQFDGFYAGVSVGHDFQAGDADEFISFDRGSNGTFGENVITAAGGNVFYQGAMIMTHAPTAACLWT